MKEFKIIDCVNYIYISEKDRWGRTLDQYLFDDIKPEKTNHGYWYKLSKIPKKVTLKKPNKRINERYELINDYHYWLCQPDVDDVLEAIEEDIKEIEDIIKDRQNGRDA